jgi:hypothetical protein
MGELVHVLLDERLEVEHHPRATLRIDRRPFREGLCRRLDGSAHLGSGGELDPGLDLAGRGVKHVAEAARNTLHMASGDEVIELFHGASPGVFRRVS